MVGRALQFATSDPKGPVYLVGAREAMEEQITPYSLDRTQWSPCGASALHDTDVQHLANELVNAEQPLVITGYSGRNHSCVDALVNLANTVKGLRILDTGGCDMCFPADHPGWLGMRYGSDASIETADVILVLDCDVPWIPTQCRPQSSARIYHIDVDPLKRLMPLFYIPATRRYAADTYTTVNQIGSYIESSADIKAEINSQRFANRWSSLEAQYQHRIASLDAQASVPPPPAATLNTSYLIRKLRQLVPDDTVFAVEGVTNSVLVADQVRATHPGQWVNCGGGGLGWSGGGALGIKLAVDEIRRKKMVVQIVGDGSFLFSVPSSVYWISHRYGIPVLTIVLNNKGWFSFFHDPHRLKTDIRIHPGWNAPRRSMLLVHPDGLGSTVDNRDLNISFEPSPDYSGIAKASSGGHIHAGRVSEVSKLDSTLQTAIEVVQSGTSAVVDALVS